MTTTTYDGNSSSNSLNIRSNSNETNSSSNTNHMTAATENSGGHNDSNVASGTNNNGNASNMVSTTSDTTVINSGANNLSQQEEHINPTFIPANSPSSSSSTSKNNGDSTFEPTIDMMVNDFDDEQTLEEEEALAAKEAEDPSVELSNLQKESDMPIEELLALYNCVPPPPVTNDFVSSSSSHNINAASQNLSAMGTKSTGTKLNTNNSLSSPSSISFMRMGGNHCLQQHIEREDIATIEENGSGEENGISRNGSSTESTDLLLNSDHLSSSLRKSRRMTSCSSLGIQDGVGSGADNEDEIPFEDGEEEENDDEDDDDDGDSKQQFQLRKLYPETYDNSGSKRLLRTLSRQSDEDDDGDYSPDEDEFKKTIMVGSEFQAVIPEGFIKYDDVLPYENEDKLLWDPSRLKEQQTEEYLKRAQQSKSQNISGVHVIPCGNHLRDDEKALYVLLQCGHNQEEALRRKRINAVTSIEQMSIWSEEECRNFESGLRLYGKDFHTIKQAKVKTRSVGELVQFYYLWKKTERHDVFANKARLEKKKYSLHPGLTDYMDRFIEEQDSNGNGSTTGASGCGGSFLNHNNNSTRDRSSSPGIVTYLQQNTEIKRHISSRIGSISNNNSTSMVVGTNQSGTVSGGPSINYMTSPLCSSNIKTIVNSTSTTIPTSSSTASSSLLLSSNQTVAPLGNDDLMQGITKEII